MSVPLEQDALSRARLEYSFWWLVLGVTSGAISLTSIVQRAFSVGLAPVLHDLIDSYRRLVYPAFDFLFQLIPLHFPGWYKDTVIISSVFATLMIRSHVVADPVPYEIIGKCTSRAIMLIGTLLLAVTLLGLLIALFELRHLRPPSSPVREELDPDDLAYIESLEHRIGADSSMSESERRTGRYVVTWTKNMHAKGGPAASKAEADHKAAWLFLISGGAMLAALVMFLLVNAGL